MNAILRSVIGLLLERARWCFIIGLAQWAGKMNQILFCDWLPERAKWSFLARSGLPAVFGKKNFSENHLINPLLTKLVRSRVYGPRLRLGP